MASGSFLIGVFAIGLVAYLFLSANSVFSGPRNLPVFPCGGATASTPKGAVLGYYTALSKHRYEDAASYVAPSNCRRFQAADGDDKDYWGNIKHLDRIAVTGQEVEHHPSLPEFASFLDDASDSPRRDLATHDKWVVVWASFDLHQYRAGPKDDGPTSQMILLGRSIQNGQWEIVDEPQV